MGEAIAELGWPRQNYAISTKFFWGLHERAQHEQHAEPQVPLAGDRRLARALRPRLRRPRRSATAPTRTRRSRRPCGRCPTSCRPGKALYWGTSEWTADEIRAAWEIAERHHLHKPVMEQPQYNLFNRRKVEHEYARLYDDIGLGLTMWSPLASGLLTGKYLDGVPDGSRADAARLRVAARRRSPTRLATRRCARCRSIADDLDCSLVAAGHRVVRGQPARLDRHHGCDNAGAGEGEHGRARRDRPARRRACSAASATSSRVS